MAISAITLFSEAKSLGYGGTLNDVKAEMAKVDRTALEQAERARYEFYIWDEETPINGKTPNWLHQHWGETWPEGGKVFIIKEDGIIAMVQYFDPRARFGYPAMDEPTALTRAQEIIDQKVESTVDAIVREQVLDALLTQ